MFRFRLQRILELREQHEQAQARVFAAAQNAAEEAQREHDALTALRAESDAHVRTSATRGSRVGHLTQLGVAMDSLDARVTRASGVVDEAIAQVQLAQRRLADAARDRRVLDRLKDRHAESFRVDAAQKDRVQMDEIALSQFSRKQGTGSGSTGASTSSNNGVTP